MFINETQENMIQASLVLLLFLVTVWILDRVLRKVSTRFSADASESFRLISNSQKAVFISVGVCLALSKLGFDVGALVAGLGLTGFALGFALKDAISNLVAGIMIVLYKPIQLGDNIQVAGCEGNVVDINLRYITVKSEGKVHLIPNSMILSKSVSIIDKPTS